MWAMPSATFFLTFLRARARSLLQLLLGWCASACHADPLLKLFPTFAVQRRFYLRCSASCIS